ncbi:MULTISPECIES: sodium:solute symporter family protein [unclassified Halomonas]|uniref:Sodium:solute symporter family protein n=1 Tax=Halomonas sp. H10-59 TaxID=2950874 RepID=A0AAU7KRT7_9GAMM|nr:MULTISPECIES: sodium:solute symporter family protein [unclassified Halomonas]KJZ04802.1 sodium:proline symporter [Halomonas sp. S2151]MBR9770474.1 sodium:solute symporter family protein [Gammaproteobacteria bacterium]MBR9880839.1 sodium:solute symporter family protein [Gammaproteobacteria bacterium]MCO7216296.1 sodium:solute symporter family protein [Halomonas sp. OfavH-34-E]
MNSHLFLATFCVYIVLMIGFGWWMSRNDRGTGDDFLLGGRSVPIFLTIGTTVATMVGTGSSMGAVGFGYANGWGGALYGLGGSIGVLLLALCFAGVRRYRFMTMSEELSFYVGANRLVRNVVALFIYVACIGWLGAHILGGGLYLAWMADIPAWQAKMVVALGFGVYCVIGGYMAVVWTDTVQAIVLFVGFFLMAAVAVVEVGGFSEMTASMDAAATSFLAIDKVGLVPALSLITVIAVGVLATPSFRQRIYSGASVGSVRRSFLVTGCLYMLFSIVPAIIGMATYALNPNLENSNFAFPYLATEVLPLWLGLLLLVAGLSATMSSASSDAIAGVTTLIRDLYVLVKGRAPSAKSVVMLSRVGLVGTIGLALAFALTSDNVIAYITKMVATVLAGMFVCGVLGRFWPRYNWQGAIASLVVASATSLTVISVESWSEYWGNPSIPAVGLAMAAGIVVSLFTPASELSEDQALELITEERERMEAVPDVPLRKGPAKA